MTWGAGPWGRDAWGGGDPAPLADFKVDSIEILSRTLLTVAFDIQVKNDSILQDETNYVITPDVSGQPVTVKAVIAPSGASTLATILEITPFTIGEQYTVTVSNLRSAVGGDVDLANNSAKFIGRLTKLDSSLGIPGFYSRDPKSTILKVFAAIAQEDDRIGGSRNDRL